MLNFLHIEGGVFFMIISHDFGIGLVEYAENEKSNDYPTIDRCPNCHAFGQVQRHGFYSRFGITENETRSIFILRMKCIDCKMTFSILPDFLLPYFQNTIHTVISGINMLLHRKKLKERRQVTSFHLKRYLRYLNWVHSSFIDMGQVLGFSGDKRKEAIKYLKMILDFGESPFLRRTWGHLNKSFMAN